MRTPEEIYAKWSRDDESWYHMIESVQTEAYAAGLDKGQEMEYNEGFNDGYEAALKELSEKLKQK